jgi:predicted DNA-binding transcriptional regulator AlpA
MTQPDPALAIHAADDQAGQEATATPATSEPGPADSLAALLGRLDEIRDLLATIARPPVAIEPLLSMKDLAVILQVSVATVERMRAAGKLPESLACGGQVRWQASEIRDWIAAGMPSGQHWRAIRRRA